MTALGKLDRAQRTLLRDQVASALRTSILSGALAPGTRLIELKIAQQMATSQGPVREALQRLAEEGLVVTLQHKGTFVTELSTEDMRELFLLRQQVEAFAARKIAPTMDVLRVQRLQHLMQAMEEAAEQDDFPGLLEHDMAFHRQVCEWAANPVFLQLWKVLDGQVRRFILQTHPSYFANLSEIAATHRPLVEALASGDPKRAAVAFSDHVLLIWHKIGASATPLHHTARTAK